MRVEIVSPEEVLWEGEASSVVVPAFTGDLGILPGRQPVLAILREGDVRVTPTGGEQVSFPITAGFVAVDTDVEIVVDNTLTLPEPE
ncbi:MAG: F0F1 ATP synthase subunit epsilon [bacterium]|nr:F0F1 ATP synthase subunit epsilon [bacterium]